VGVRRRILVAVEPALLRAALVDVLTHIGLDDVTSADNFQGAGDGFDAAIVSSPPSVHPAVVVIETPDLGLTLGHVHADGHTVDLHLNRPSDLLQALDKYCPTTGARADLVDHLPDPEGEQR
jgi:hypothetical protein